MNWYFSTTLSHSLAIYPLMNSWNRCAVSILIIFFFLPLICSKPPWSTGNFNSHSLLIFHSLTIHCEETSVFNVPLAKFHFHCIWELKGREQKLLLFTPSDFRDHRQITFYRRLPFCHTNLLLFYRLINPNSQRMVSVQLLGSILLFRIYFQCH